MPATIALLSDFGLSDVYVGVMKGVLLRSVPEAHIIDLTHEIPPGDIRTGALRLWQAAPFMPPGTIFLSVVDPGVGSERRAMAAEGPGFFFVGPDNGLFTYLVDGSAGVRAVEIAPGDAASPSDTFHGRDIFAPAAARLAAGAPMGDLGPPIEAPVLIPFPRLQLDERGVSGEVLSFDRFGNIITSIGRLRRGSSGLRLEPWVPDRESRDLPPGACRARLPGGRQISLARTFSDAPPGGLLAYIGSSGLLEIGANGGSARDALGLAPGSPIFLVFS